MLWNIETGELDHELRQNSSGLSDLENALYRIWHGTEAVAVAPDGKTLAAVPTQRLIHVAEKWSIDGDARQVTSISGQSDSAGPILFSPNGKIVAAAYGGWGLAAGVRFLDVDTWISKSSVDVYAGAVTFVAYSPDGRFLLCGGYETGLGREAKFGSGFSVELIDTAVPKIVASLEGATSAVLAGVITPDGSLAIVGEEHGVIRSWDIARYVNEKKPQP